MEKRINKNKRKWGVVDVLLVILLIIAIICFALSFFIAHVTVVQSSMLPTISSGDKIWILKTKNVSRNDIIVFEGNEENDKNLIKRVVAVSGDTLRIEDGILFLTYSENNEIKHKMSKESYIYNGDNIDVEEITIPEGKIYVLGDNRLISLDSSEFGPIDKEQIIGKMIIK